MKATLIIVGIIFIVSIGCQVTDRDYSSVLDYEVRKIDYQTPNCAPERDACLMAQITYPEFVSGDSLAIYLANRIIRNSTLDFIGMGDVEAAETPRIEVAVEDLNASFLRFKGDFPQSHIGWEARILCKELYRNDTVLVFETNAMTYFGGAHPNKNTRYFNFDRKDGRLVPLEQFIGDPEHFTARAAATFRAKYVPAGQSLNEAGFSFLGNQFVLPANYALVGDSIKLHYNHYEIAAYAAGSFAITVSRFE